MNQTTYFGGKVLKYSLPVFQGAPPADALGPKRLALPQGELANFHDSQEGIRYIASLELRPGTVRGNHWHQIKEEQLYLLAGSLLLVVQERESAMREEIQLWPGDLVLIMPGIAHAMKTLEAGYGIEFSRHKFNPTDVQRLTLI